MRATPVVVVAAGLLGLTAGTILRGRADAHLAPTVDQGIYYFHESDCNFLSSGDPINVVFVGLAADKTHVEKHMAHHGLGSNDLDWIIPGATGAFEYFHDHECEGMDGQAATGSAIDPRTHARWNEGDINGQLDFDPNLQAYYSVAPTHYEDNVFCGSFFDHFIPPNFGRQHVIPGNVPYPPGGYNTGQEELFEAFVGQYEVPHHFQTDSVAWNNTAVSEQCNGEFAWGDGIVYYISMDSLDDTGGGWNPNKGFAW